MPGEHCNSFIQNLPLIGLMLGRTSVNTPLTTRIIETAVMAIVGLIASYVLIIPKMEEKFNNLEKTVTEVKQDVKQIQRDLYVPRSTRDSNNIHERDRDRRVPQGSSDVFPYQKLD